MPSPGDIVSGNDIGRNRNKKYIRVICPDCPPEQDSRWIERRHKGQSPTRRCKAHHFRGKGTLGPTSQKAIALRVADPYMTQAAIANQLGVSRERIRQIMNAHNLITQKVIPKCPVCGVAYRKTHSNQQFCSMRCWGKSRRVTVNCHSCGKAKEIRISDWKNNTTNPRYTGKFFCDRRCSGRHLGTNYGIGRSKSAVVSSLFMDIAQELLPEEAYGAILEQATERMKYQDPKTGNQ
jgi:hypothetical protein